MKSFENLLRFILKHCIIFSVFIASSLICVGCATIFKGSTDPVNFTSEPSGAEVYVDGILLGTTPFQMELKSAESYKIEFRKDGHITRTILLNNSVGAGWIILDVFGGIIPVVIDAATGNWYSLDQATVNAVLETQALAKDKE